MKRADDDGVHAATQSSARFCARTPSHACRLARENTDKGSHHVSLLLDLQRVRCAGQTTANGLDRGVQVLTGTAQACLNAILGRQAHELLRAVSE